MAEKTVRHGRSLTEWIIIAGLTLVAIQIVAIILNGFIKTPIYLGPAFIVFLVAACSLFGFTVTVKVMKGQSLEKKDIVSLILVIGLTILALVFLRPLVPEIFKPGVQAMYAFINP
jgi:hypothetical protein